MQSVWRLIGLTVVVTLASSAQAQPAPFDAVIAVAAVEVRSGPSTMYYPTGKLFQGNHVRVLEEKDGGWLTIEPPQGSFSWVENRVLGKNTGYEAVVLAPEAPVRVGSALTDRSPDVIGAKLKAGTVVKIMGEAKVAADGSKWWPIKPQREVRYIPKDAVRSTPLVQAVTAEANKVGLPASADALWLQAEQAWQAGNVAEAQRLYEQCLRTPGIDANLQYRCSNRLATLHDGNRYTANPAYQPGRPAEAVTPTLPYQPPPVTAYRPPQPPALPAQLPVPSTQAAGYRPAATAATSNPGWLRRAGFMIDGKQAYALENSQGQLLMYATGQGGLSLEPYVGHNVTLIGSVTYHGEAKKYYIQATQVSALP